MATTISDPTAQAIINAAAATPVIATPPLSTAQQKVISAGSAQGITGLQFDPTSAAAAATANTAAAAANTPAPAASSSSSTLSTLTTVSSLAPLLGKFVSGTAGTALGAGLSVLGVGLNAYSGYNAALSMFQNGFSFSKLGSLAMAAVSIEVAIAMPMIVGGIPIMLALSTAFLPALVIVAAVVLIAFLVSLFGKKPNAAEQQIANFNNLTVWTSSQVLTLASASTFILMGYNIDNAMTSLNAAGMLIPTSTLTQLLANNMTNADGSAYSGGVPYGVPIVLKGAGSGGGDEVMIVSQAGIQKGVAEDSIQTYDLARNMAFTKPTDPSLNGAYIPFFVNGKVNPQAVTAVNTQRALLLSTPNLAAASQTNGVAVAAASNKQGVQATSVP